MTSDVSRSGGSGESAARRFVSGFEETLAAEHAASVAPSDQEISDYVDGALDDVAREIFEARLADDPPLQAAVDDLRALRAEMAVSPATVLAHPRSGRLHGSHWIGLAAGVLLGVAALGWWLAGEPPGQARLLDHGRLIAVGGSELAEPGNVPAPFRDEVRAALMTGRLTVGGGVGRVRVTDRPLMSTAGESPAFRVVQPVATFVRTDRPTFRWTPAAGATAYRVGVYGDRLDPVAESGPVEAVEWTPETALPRGRVLLWQVETETSDGRRLAPTPPDPQARFEILPEATAAALDSELGAAAGSHLARAVVLARAGLVDDAREALEALRRENPGAAIVGRLLASLEPGP
jgi:hypothetical protein